MADTKILQAILDGQVSIREDLKRVEKKVDDVFDSLKKLLNKLENHFLSA